MTWYFSCDVPRTHRLQDAIESLKELCCRTCCVKNYQDAIESNDSQLQELKLQDLVGMGTFVAGLAALTNYNAIVSSFLH